MRESRVESTALGSWLDLLFYLKDNLGVSLQA